MNHSEKFFALVVVVFILTACNKEESSPVSNDSSNTIPANTWTTQSSGTTRTLNGVWGTSANNVYAVGDSGTLLHYNGSSWSRLGPYTSKSLRGIFGFSDTSIFAVGSGMTVLKYDGSSWSTTVVYHSTWYPSLWSIWGSSPTNLWAVGGGWIRCHYINGSWSGSTNTITDWLASVYGTSASNILTVGDWGRVFKFNGSYWTQLDVTDRYWVWLDLRGVWAASATEYFVVGDYDSNGSSDTDSSGIVLKYNGTTWTTVWENGVRQLRSVWGNTSSDFYVAGLAGSIAHYNGTSFSLMPTGTTQNILGIWGTGNDWFAVGTNGTILHLHR